MRLSRPWAGACTDTRKATETHSAQVVVARVLAVELAGSVEAEISAKTVGVGRRALSTGLGREERGPALLAGQADVGSRARIACTPDRTAIKSGRTRLSSWPHTTTTTRRQAHGRTPPPPQGGTPVPAQLAARLCRSEKTPPGRGGFST